MRGYARSVTGRNYDRQHPLHWLVVTAAACDMWRLVRTFEYNTYVFRHANSTTTSPREHHIACSSLVNGASSRWLFSCTLTAQDAQIEMLDYWTPCNSFQSMTMPVKRPMNLKKPITCNIALMAWGKSSREEFEQRDRVSSAFGAMMCDSPDKFRYEVGSRMHPTSTKLHLYL